MTKLRYSARFIKQYKKLIKRDPHLQPRIEKQIQKFIDNLRSGGLHSHKVIYNGEEAFTFSITRDLRIAYKWHGEYALFLDIDNHDNLYR